MRCKEYVEFGLNEDLTVTNGTEIQLGNYDILYKMDKDETMFINMTINNKLVAIVFTWKDYIFDRRYIENNEVKEEPVRVQEYVCSIHQMSGNYNGLAGGRVDQFAVFKFNKDCKETYNYAKSYNNLYDNVDKGTITEYRNISNCLLALYNHLTNNLDTVYTKRDIDREKGKHINEVY